MPSGHRPQQPVGTARVAISGRGAGGNTWVNVFWLSLTATTHVASDLGNIENTMATAFGTRFLPSMASEFSLSLIKTTWLYAAGQAIEVQQTLSGNGTGGTQNSTDSTCALINWSILDFYRGGHPRTYLAGLPENHISNGRLLDSSYASTLATAAQGFLADCNALTHGGISAAALGTVRFASGNAWLSPPVFRAYQGASVNPILATQRRRLAR